MTTSHAESAPRGRLRILIADDCSFVRKLLEHEIRSAGHEVVAVSDGLKAITALRDDTSIQVALLDWNMPGGIDGQELCELVSKLNHPVYTIVITAETSSEVTVSALNAGANDFVVKPWVNEVLLARIGVAWRLISMRNQLEAATNELLQRIEQQKSLQVQLLHSQKMESIGQLAAGIAHEINTPIQYVGDNTRFIRDSVTQLLNIVKSYAAQLDPEMKKRDWDDRVAEVKKMVEDADIEFLIDEIPKAIEQTLSGVERVAEIVGAMKVFSHPDSGQKIPIDLNKAITSTITVCRNRWKYVADLETDLQCGLPMVPCMAGEFNQVMLNIIINAADAIGGIVGDGAKGKGRITVTTRQDGEFVEIRVIDTGGGIPDNIRSKIFDPFFTTKQVGKGTGQGLAISHDVIVSKHSGTIDTEVDPGVGTTFIIRLPLTQQTTMSPEEAA